MQQRSRRHLALSKSQFNGTDSGVAYIDFIAFERSNASESTMVRQKLLTQSKFRAKENADDTDE